MVRLSGRLFKLRSFEFADCWFNKYNYIRTCKLCLCSTSDLDCGDSLFTSSSGFVHFPVNPTEYSARVNCNYTISTTNASTFSLILALWKMLDSLIDCSRDYITVCVNSVIMYSVNPPALWSLLLCSLKITGYRSLRPNANYTCIEWVTHNISCIIRPLQENDLVIVHCDIISLS